FYPQVGFLFAWCDFLIIRPCNIGMMAYVFARYARQLIHVDHQYTFVGLAVTSVVLLSLIHLIGLRPGVWSLNILVLAKIVGLAAVVGAAFWTNAPDGASQPWPPLVTVAETSSGGISLALLFVLFTYGGWAEVSFVAAEIKDPRRNAIRSLVIGVLLVTAIYVALNLVIVQSLGMGGFADSKAVAHDVIQRRFGNAAASTVDVLICLSCLGAIQGTMLAGSRLYCAWGADSRWLSWIGEWNKSRDLPVRAILIQSAITIGLIVAFGPDEGAFKRLIVFSTPFYWFFFTLVGIAVLVLRRNLNPNDHEVSHESGTYLYRMPCFPIPAVVLIGSSGWLFYSSTTYAWSQVAWQSVWAIIVLAIGIPLALISFRENR
ncbi:MAG: APC family permease, partial [Planctomycetota bacterium]